jgi:hypothetical protein
MSSLKNRVRRLEESQKAKAGPVSYESTPEEKQWLYDTALTINEGTPRPPSPRIDISGYSPARLAVIASAKAWLNEIISETKTVKVRA